MGRGLGTLQRAVLDYLNRRSGAGYASDVAYELHNGDKDERDSSPPPRSTEVAVRRAVKTLEARGLVKTGYYSGWDGETSLQIWLPDATPRHRPKTRQSWSDIDRTVHVVLSTITTDDVQDWLRYGRGGRGYCKLGQGVWDAWRQQLDGYPTKPPGIPYPLAVKRIADALGMMDYGESVLNRARRPINRALQNLVAAGAIEALPSSRRTYHAVRLLRQPE